MPASKKPRKPHRRKACRPPAMLYRAYGELTDDNRRDLMLTYRAPVDAVLRGDDVQIGSWMHGRTALCVAYELALAFERESEIRLATLLGVAGYDLCVRAATAGARPAREIVEPCRCAFEILDEMMLSATREDLARALYRADDRRTLSYDPKAVSVVIAEDRDTWKHIEEWRAMAFVHGRPTIGYLEWSDERAALLWKMPREDSQIVVTDPMLVIATQIDIKGD